MLIKAQTTLCLSALGIVPLKRNEKKIKFKALTSKLTNWCLLPLAPNLLRLYTINCLPLEQQ